MDASTARPQPDQLDYVLLRLADDAGNKPVGNATMEGQRRGWLEISTNGYSLPADSALIIIQSPSGRSLQMVID